MGAFSIWHWIIVLIVVLILFGGKGKLSSIMGDFGKGLKNFKDQIKSNKENEEEIEVITETKTKPKKKTVKKTAKKKTRRNFKTLTAKYVATETKKKVQILTGLISTLGPNQTITPAQITKYEMLIMLSRKPLITYLKSFVSSTAFSFFIFLFLTALLINEITE